VSEQIKALQDINQLVGRSTQSLEVSQPAPRPAQNRSTTAEAMAAAAQAQRIASTPVTQTPIRGTLAPEAHVTARRANQQPAADPATGNVNGGWISDLLRGASRDGHPAAQAAPAQPQHQPQAAEAQARRPDTRNPRHVVESLNSLSVDIARAIDHDASVDLWRRYQRGEKDVFTRRLYTLKGQQTFDEIQRKYEREPEFRTAVDRYIGDFEKLLSDVAKTDRDRSVTQSYLTSDTGKVYTMLAHAAGRFNQ
jgi:hypothetical protein